MEKVSVIVPVYRVEQYIDKCVESIVNQTYTNLEIILVDDGSPDNCPQMCDEWAKKDSRIKVIHKKNGGLSDARNAGIDAASGNYVYFLDSDDSISIDTLETYINISEKENCDIVFGRYQRVFDDPNKNQIINCTNELYIYSIADFWNVVYKVNKELGFEICVNCIISCNKLFRKSLFSDIRYLVGKKNEDEYIIHELVSKCKKIAFIDKVYYYYYQNEESIMGSIRKTHFHNDFFDAVIRRVDYFQKNKMEIADIAFDYYKNMFEGQYFITKDEEYKVLLKKKYRNLVRVSRVSLKKCSRKDRMKSIIFYINPKWLKWLYKIKNYYIHKLR